MQACKFTGVPVLARVAEGVADGIALCGAQSLISQGYFVELQLLWLSKNQLHVISMILSPSFFHTVHYVEVESKSTAE